MLVSPDIHFTLTVSAEVVQYVCATVSFIVAVWGTLTMTKLLMDRE